MIDESKGCPLSLGGLFLLSVCICEGHSNTQWPKTGIHLKLGKPENPDRISVGRPFSVPFIRSWPNTQLPYTWAKCRPVSIESADVVPTLPVYTMLKGLTTIYPRRGNGLCGPY